MCIRYIRTPPTDAISPSSNTSKFFITIVYDSVGNDIAQWKIGATRHSSPRLVCFVTLTFDGESVASALLIIPSHLILFYLVLWFSFDAHHFAYVDCSVHNFSSFLFSFWFTLLMPNKSVTWFGRLIFRANGTLLYLPIAVIMCRLWFGVIATGKMTTVWKLNVTKCHCTFTILNGIKYVYSSVWAEKWHTLESYNARNECFKSLPVNVILCNSQSFFLYYFLFRFCFRWYGKQWCRRYI